MSNKYWQSFGELKGSEELAKKIENEFQEELPFEESNGKGWLDASAPRRDFLKYLGFSTAAAAIAAGCKTPVRKAVPFANKPADIVPGVSKYYATTYVQDGDILPILAKVRDGRPIKIEGNDECTYTGGKTSARAQASVLDLYDTNRLTHPKRKVGDKFEEMPTFEQLDKMIADAMAGASNPVLLTSTLTSPTTKEIIAKYPGLKHVQYDADSFSGMLMANEASFGKRAIPSYNFANAKIIVSLGADFLGTWLNPVEFARQYSQKRKLSDTNVEMSRHLQFESFMSMTGANADERFTHRPSESGPVALALYAAIVGNAATHPLSDKVKAGIAKAAAELNANKGAALVVSGSNDTNVQMIVNAINNAIGAYGPVIDWSTTLNYRQGVDADITQLIADMNSGSVGALMIYGANPVYNYYDADKFKSAMAKVKVKVSFNEYLDETTQECNYIIPSHHFLESWGDAEPKSGYISFIQPTIHPLFKTRSFQTSLLKWSGTNMDYETYFKNYWEAKLGSKAAFETALQRGVLDPKGASIPVSPTPSAKPDSLAAGTPIQTTVTQARPTTAGGYNGGSVEAAAAAGVISSNAENASIHYLDATPNTNPLWVDLVASGRQDFIGANTLVDAMNALNDPRRLAYFQHNLDDPNTPEVEFAGGEYDINSIFSQYSNVSKGDVPSDFALLEPTFPGTLMSYAEVEFLLAEAVERGYAVGGTAEEHYNNAIRASFEEWGLSSADADAYLAQPAVAYATAAGPWQQKIGTQAWIALYNRGYEAWHSYRRLDYPVLVAPPDAESPIVPVRMTYPIVEQTLNPDQYDAAAAAIGGDLLTTKLFFDVH